MKTLNFCVYEQRLKQIKTNEDSYLVNNTNNYLQLKFKFNPTWADYDTNEK